MTDPFARVFRDLEVEIDNAHYHASQAFLTKARELVDKHDLRNHQLHLSRIYGLCVKHKRNGRECVHWEMQHRDDCYVLQTIRQIGETFDQLPDGVKLHLDGTII